jgi:hypothetical protein
MYSGSFTLLACNTVTKYPTKMLQLLHQSYLSFLPMIKQISGVVFFGVPHITQDRAQAKTALEQLLKCQTTDSFKSKIPPFQDEAVDAVLELCDYIRCLNLHVPILTVYESRGTKINRTFFSRIRGSARNPVVSTSIPGTVYN